MSEPSDHAPVCEHGNHLLAAAEWAAAAEAFSQWLTRMPDDWQALAGRALARYRLGAYDLALDDYCRALALEPASVGLLTNFAVLLKDLGQLELAENLLLQALQLAPRHADAWSNLGIVRLHRLRYDDAAQCHINALEHGGESPARWTNLGNALTGGLHLVEAIEAYDHALALDPGCDDARYNQSIPLLTLGRYAEAWPAYEARWKTILTPRLTERRWQGEALGAGTLLIWSEQGLGDCLQMARFVPVLRQAYPEARLVLACPASLHALFAGLGDIELIAADATVAHDWQIPLCSLPGVLGVTLDTLPRAPYLRADPARVAHWGAALSPRRAGVPRIGLVWQSGVWGVGVRDLCRQYKSIDAEGFLPLPQGFDFVSLQPDALPAAFAGCVQAPAIADFADTAALIEQLDLVVSVDTAVAHLAGGMGKPVWVLMRHEGAPFFGATGETAPWYPSARVLRQSMPGDWAPVLAALRAGLSLHFSRNTP